jgi:hypothetical protein
MKMFIGNLVKLKSDVVRNNDKKEFVENAIKEEWLWIITAMDNEELDYIIQPLYLHSECGGRMTQLGGELLVLYDEIENVELSKDELFKALRNY